LKRPKIPPRLRREVFARDRFTCRACGWCPDGDFSDYDGRHAPKVLVRVERRRVGPPRPSYNGGPDRTTYRNHEVYRELVVDHIYPISLGGAFGDPANLQALCSTCNGEKWNRV